MPFRIELLDGQTLRVGKCSAKRYAKREDFVEVGKNWLKQIRLKAASSMDWLTKMPPADIKNIEQPAVKNLAKIGTSYGNGNLETRAMINARFRPSARVRRGYPPPH